MESVQREETGCSATPLVEVLVVGAGPHALTFLARLLEREPSVEREHLRKLNPGNFRESQTHKSTRRIRDHFARPNPQLELLQKVMVVDPAGEWLARWRAQFEALGIPYLRSHISLSPDPYDNMALSEYIDLVKRNKNKSKAKRSNSNNPQEEEEMTKTIDRLNRTLHYHGPFELPSSRIFMRFCDKLLDMYHLRDVVQKGTVDNIEPIMDCDDQQEEHEHCHYVTQNAVSRCVKHFRVTFADGREIHARRVIVAIGHTNVHRRPWWMDVAAESFREHVADETIEPPMRHVWDLVYDMPALRDLSANNGKERHSEEKSPSWDARGKRILIVGGGLTSVHLANAAVEHGASFVRLACRRRFRVAPFDVRPEWMGRFRFKELKKFWQIPCMRERLAALRVARNGGATISPDGKRMLNELRARCGREGRAATVFDVKENVDVWDIRWAPEHACWEVETSDDSVSRFDWVWTATGSEMDVRRERCMRGVLERCPIEIVEGLPAIEENLRWAPGCELYVMGAYAALQLGPDALNLGGARRGSDKLVASVKEQLV